MGIGGLEVLTKPDSDLDLDTDEELESDDSKHSHIVERDPEGRDAHLIVMEARVNGTPVRALCGYTWVPQQDPEKLPLCSKCNELFGLAQDIRGRKGNLTP